MAKEQKMVVIKEGNVSQTPLEIILGVIVSFLA
jgi:hypothetical protein